MVEDAKHCVRRFYEEVWNRGSMTAAHELATPDCVRHDPAGPVPIGPSGFAAMATRWRSALPDLRLHIDLLLAEADLVAARWTISGTHAGALGSIPPSGKVVTFSGVNVFRVVSGRIAEIWNHRDDLSLYQQIGALPPLPR
jgi:steroid delta-isomerase-like uncharacterized protein